METRFTPQEFDQQICEFRKMFGDKSFWALPDAKREKACEALAFCYMHMHLDTPKEEINRCAMTLETTITEYERRKFMLIKMGTL